MNFRSLDSLHDTQHIISMAQFTPVKPSSTHPIHRIGIVGTGLIGGSLALAASRAGFSVVVYDVDSDVMQAARTAGLKPVQTPGEACKDADLVVVATPVEDITATIPMIKPYIAKDAIVTDVGSVKGPAKAMVSGLASPNHRVISCHPMAGKATSGFHAAEPDLFLGCVNILFGDFTDPDVRRLAHFFNQLGVAVNLAASLDVNDIATAVVSHFPQVVASLLAKVAGEVEDEIIPGAFVVAGPGWRDSTRIAESSFSMWKPIIEANSVLLSSMLEKLSQQAAVLSAALKVGDMKVFEDLFTQAQNTRQRYQESREFTPHESEPSTVSTKMVSPLLEFGFINGSAWTDTSAGYETVRTSSSNPQEHVRIAAAFVAHLTGADPQEAYTITQPSTPHSTSVVKALSQMGVVLEERRTWTADGLLANGVVVDGRFLVIN